MERIQVKVVNTIRKRTEELKAEFSAFKPTPEYGEVAPTNTLSKSEGSRSQTRMDIPRSEPVPRSQEVAILEKKQKLPAGPSELKKAEVSRDLMKALVSNEIGLSRIRGEKVSKGRLIGRIVKTSVSEIFSRH